MVAVVVTSEGGGVAVVETSDADVTTLAGADAVTSDPVGAEAFADAETSDAAAMASGAVGAAASEVGAETLALPEDADVGAEEAFAAEVISEDAGEASEAAEVALAATDGTAEEDHQIKTSADHPTTTSIPTRVIRLQIRSGINPRLLKEANIRSLVVATASHRTN